MSHTPRGRTALRAATASAVALAASLGVASQADAAMGGGTPPSLIDIPNLVSVTTSSTAATFTFDRTIDCTCNGADFRLGGYSASLGAVIPGTAATVSGNAVRVTFGGTTPDTDALTYGTVVDGAVHTQGSLGATNLSDSTRITGAEGESGTRGHTVGPDLVSAVATGGGTNVLSLTFDQNVNPAAVDETDVHIVKADGSIANGVAGSAQVDDNVVEVQFAAADPVAGAKSAYVDEVGPAFEAEDIAFPSPLRSVQIGTQNQVSVAPQLTSAELTSSDTVVFTFDKNVANAAAAQFFVKSADDDAPLAASSAVVVNGNQVQAQFASDQFSEYLVSASTGPAAVQSLSGSVNSVPGGKPIGGNAGAKATGFTTAPDAVEVSYSGASAVVTLDSRVAPGPVAGNFQLLGDDGSIIATATTATPQAQGVPGPSRVNLLYTTDAIDQAKGMRLLYGAVAATSAAGFQNPPQQIGR